MIWSRNRETQGRMFGSEGLNALRWYRSHVAVHLIPDRLPRIRLMHTRQKIFHAKNTLPTNAPLTRIAYTNYYFNNRGDRLGSVPIYLIVSPSPAHLNRGESPFQSAEAVTITDIVKLRSEYDNVDSFSRGESNDNWHVARHYREFCSWAKPHKIIKAENFESPFREQTQITNYLYSNSRNTYYSWNLTPYNTITETICAKQFFPRPSWYPDSEMK